jgi:hypothetical protein
VVQSRVEDIQVSGDGRAAEAMREPQCEVRVLWRERAMFPTEWQVSQMCQLSKRADQSQQSGSGVCARGDARPDQSLGAE